VLLVWGGIVAISGGIDTRVLGVALRSRDPFRALVGGLIVLLVYAGFFRQEAERDFDRLMGLVRARARLIAATAALLLAMHGIVLGTFTAGGSDSWGYVSQAYGWASGVLPRATPLTIDLPLPDSDSMQTPLGYRIGPTPHTLVPTYSPGLPLLMALALIAGPCGPFLVVPLCGMFFVWCTYRIGELAAGRVNGVLAAVIAATSPVVLFQNLMPMSDVPAGAFWTAAVLFSFGTRRRDTAAAALCASIGLLIRPNLLVLAAVPLVQLMLSTRGRRWWLHAAAFCAPLGAAAIGIAVLNTLWFGAPSNSGYGTPAELYSWSNVWPNVKLYGGWLLRSESWGVFVALVPLVPGLARNVDRHVIRICVATCVVTLACYLSYYQFDVWWYLRFLIPAGGTFAVLIATGFTSMARLFRRPYAQAAAALACALFLSVRFSFAKDSGALGGVRTGERRYVEVGEFVVRNLPENAAIFSMQHSGSLRFYSGRLTLRYDSVQKEWAKGVPAAVERAGYHPFLIIDDWETPQFREHWGLAPTDPLPWPVIAHMRESGGLTVFDLATTPGSITPAALVPGNSRRCSALHPLHR
jgi:hypothetical protein